MITAFVLVQVEAHRIPEAVQEIADVPGVTEVYSCTGTIDLIAIVKTRIPEDLAQIVSTKVSKVVGVKSTDTHLEFRSFSQRDIDACFSAGLTQSPQPAEQERTAAARHAQEILDALGWVRSGRVRTRNRATLNLRLAYQQDPTDEEPLIRRMYSSRTSGGEISTWFCRSGWTRPPRSPVWNPYTAA